jgi:hypothetical protein
MSRLTKGDLINRAFKKMRISGKTKLPQGDEIEDALADLESYCAELDGTGYVTGYNYEDTPDPGSETGLDRSLHKAFVKVLAVELMPDYGKGKDPDPLLMKQALGGLSVIHRITKQRRTSHLPPTFPIGKHARSRWSNVSRKFYPERESVPFIPSPYLIYEGDISPQQEDMGQWLQPLDDVGSYTIEATIGLQINSDSLDGNVVKYVVQATGETNSVDTQAMRVDIVVTTVLGEVRTIKRYFSLKIK